MRILILSIALVFSGVSNAQETTLLWQRSIGAAGDDNITSVAVDSDENIYVMGSQQANNSSNDLYLLKMNENGDLLWKKEFGGSGDEYGSSIFVNEDGSVTLLGSTNSKDEFNPNGNGYQDIFLLHVASNGSILSKFFYGGSFIDMPTSIIRSGKGRYLISAYSRSYDGDLSENNGQYDMWIFEVDASGQILWQKNFGGSDDDMAIKTLRLSDGNYMVLGQSTSYTGAYADNKGDLDVTLIKIDPTGHVFWQRSYGGFYDDLAADILELENGNILIASNTFSNQFDVQNNHGGSDVWLFEVDASSQIVWSETYGSDGNENIASLKRSGSGFFLFGTSNSTSMNTTLNNGKQDFWLYEIDEVERTIIDVAFFGASGFDSGNALVLLNDGSLLLGGDSNSNDGVVQGNSGRTDGWIIKVRRDFGMNTDFIHVHPNPSNGVYYINNIPANAEFQLYDANGHQMDTQVFSGGFAGILDLSSYNSGMYILTVISPEGTQTSRLIKN